MPVAYILHEGNAFSFYCLSDNCCRHSLCLSSFFKCRTDLIEIISINIDHMEVECLEFFIDRVRRTYFVHCTVNLKVIVIYNDYKIVQFLKTSPHCCFPDLSFLNLSITAKCVYTVIFFVILSNCRHTNCNRQSLSK